MASPAFENYNVIDPTLTQLAAFIDARAAEIVKRAERAWDSSILLFAQLSDEQREKIRALARDTVAMWATRLRQDPAYARRVHELGQEWGEQAASWQLHVYSFTKALDLLAHAVWEYLAEDYSMDKLTPESVFFLGRVRDQVVEDIRVPLLSIYLQKREVEMEETRFALQSTLSLPGRSLLIELGNRLQANRDRVIPAWIDSVRHAPNVTSATTELLQQRGGAFVDLLLSLLQSPTPETGTASLSSVRSIGLESARAGVSFQEMFHALQQLRPILWDTVYEIYRREQYWHPAEFIEALARLHLLLDLFSEGIGQAYLTQKEMIIQEQSEELRRRDLSLAREILEGLLPHQQMQIPYTDIGSVWIPSREIGGDFYDIFPLRGGDVMFIIGDVSGKGISAALLVSMVKYVLKANAPFYESPADLAMAANALLYQDMGPEMFVTLFAARYTPTTGRIIYTSAGHDTCYICRCEGARQMTMLPSLGPILGVFPEIVLEERQASLHEGDTLLLYTDGLVNVRCADHQTINSRRLCVNMQQFHERTAQEMAQQLLETTIHDCEPTDDITMMLVKRRKGGDHG